MGIIYIITNDINDNVYIGQTIQPLKVRWSKHIRDSKNKTGHLQLAFKKYGVEHFQIAPIEECENDMLDEREIYWIAKYDSYRNGYNSTLGGMGRHANDYSEIYKLWDEGYNPHTIALLVDIPYSTILPFLKEYASDFYERASKYRSASNSKYVYQYSLDGKYIKKFNSMTQASKETGILASSITQCCRGRNNVAGEYQWKYYQELNGILPVPRSGNKGFPVTQYDKQGNEIARYTSAVEAERVTGIKSSAICGCCNGKRQSAGKFIWKRSN